MEENKVIRSVRLWVNTIVVDLNLCPFAKRELIRNSVRFCVSQATTEEQLLIDLQTELELLGSEPEVETTLLIHPDVLKDFYDYNQFLDYVDRLLIDMALEGVYQVASFHPDYQFGGTQPEDVENFTNKSPYPILHLIREDSLEVALANYPNPEKIPGRNIELLESMGQEKMHILLQTCFHDAEN